MDDALTITEAAALLGIPARSVRAMVKDGTLQAEKVTAEHGQTYMIRPEQLEKIRAQSGQRSEMAVEPVPARWPEPQERPIPSEPLQFRRAADQPEPAPEPEPEPELASEPAPEPETTVALNEMHQRPDQTEQIQQDLPHHIPPVSLRPTEAPGDMIRHTFEVVSESHVDDIEAVIRQIVQPLTDQLASVISQLREADKAIGRLEAERDAALELLSTMDESEETEKARPWWRLW